MVDEPGPLWRRAPARLLDEAGVATETDFEIIEEVPVAFSYGGIAHAVMMATPADLHDFAVGFSITERIASGMDDIRDVSISPGAGGMTADVTLAPAAFSAFLGRRRMRSLRGHTSCGLCGVEDLADIDGEDPAQSRAALSRLRHAGVAPPALRSVLEQLRDFQPLSRRTHAAHAAAWADGVGTVLLVREDVGRHNALDKLIGACLRGGVDLSDGFCTVTSRCSVEMVQKAIAARFCVLAAVSAPTAAAVRLAQAAGLTLIARASVQRQHVFAGDPAGPHAVPSDAGVATTP